MTPNDTFQPGLPWVVKSVRQRDLLNCWLRLSRNAAGLPQREAYQPGRLADELSDMMEFDVVCEDTAPRFRITFEGARLSIAYGHDPDAPATASRQFLDSSIGRHRYAAVARSYMACLDLRQPIYTVSITHDSDGKEVSYERLLLPFGTGAEVAQIVGSYKTISLEGGFKVANLMSLTAETPQTVMRVAIDPALRAPPPAGALASQMATDPSEIVEL